MKKDRYEEISRRAAKFNREENARSYADHCIKAHMIILGDDEKYWVVTFADAAALEKAGLEVLR